MTGLKDPNNITNNLLHGTAAHAAAVGVLDAHGIDTPDDGDFGMSKHASHKREMQFMSGEGGNFVSSNYAGSHETDEEEKRKKDREQAPRIIPVNLDPLSFEALSEKVKEVLRVATAELKSLEEVINHFGSLAGQADSRVKAVEAKYEAMGTPILTADKVFFEDQAEANGFAGAIHKNPDGSYYAYNKDGVKVNLDADQTQRVNEYIAAHPDQKFIFGNDPRIPPADLKTLHDDAYARETALHNAGNLGYNISGQGELTTIANNIKYDLQQGNANGTLTPERKKELETQLANIEQQQQELSRLNKEVLEGVKNGTISQKRLNEIADRLEQIKKYVEDIKNKSSGAAPGAGNVLRSSGAAFPACGRCRCGRIAHRP